jgi:drug/metabolite transporter (DMT)-like permease
MKRAFDLIVALTALVLLSPFMLVVAMLAGKPFSIDPSPVYLISLIYLALFGSVVAFGCYLTLVGRIGADRAAYATLLFPIIALIISTLFEGYHWSPPAVAGVVIILMGNALALSAFELRSMRLRWPVRSRRQPHQDVNLS